jgi:hypothetical protein
VISTWDQDHGTDGTSLSALIWCHIRFLTWVDLMHRFVFLVGMPKLNWICCSFCAIHMWAGHFFLCSVHVRIDWFSQDWRGLSFNPAKKLKLGVGFMNYWRCSDWE